MNELTQEERDVLTVWHWMKENDGDIGAGGCTLWLGDHHYDFWKTDEEGSGVHAAADWVRKQEAQQ